MPGVCDQSQRWYYGSQWVPDKVAVIHFLLSASLAVALMNGNKKKKSYSIYNPGVEFDSDSAIYPLEHTSMVPPSPVQSSFTTVTESCGETTTFLGLSLPNFVDTH